MYRHFNNQQSYRGCYTSKFEQFYDNTTNYHTMKSIIELGYLAGA